MHSYFRIASALTSLIIAGGLWTGGAQASASTVNVERPAAPHSFVLLDEQSAHGIVVRMWYNTSNGAIHGFAVDPTLDPGTYISVSLFDANGSVVGYSVIAYGSTEVNTAEYVRSHVHACAANGHGDGVCTHAT